MDPSVPIEITNFSGALTRVRNGELNSGKANYNASWGYDPFSKPMNLTWFEAPVDITGPIGLPLAAKPRTEGSAPSTPYIYLMDLGKKLYKIQTNSLNAANVDSVIGIASVATGGLTYTYGASMDFYLPTASVGGAEKIYVSGDQQINSINFDGTADAVVGNSNKMAQNTFHPFKQFVGKLFFGNGATLGAVDSTGLINSTVASVFGGSMYSELNPPLPADTNIKDLDVTITQDYLMMTAGTVPAEELDIVNRDLQYTATNDGNLYKWNAIDPAVTSGTTIPSYEVTALQTFLGNTMFFSVDSLGASINDGTNKILSLPNNKSALPNATCVNGNFLTWACPEVSADKTAIYASLYYYGSLDSENPTGLYRMMRWATTQANATVYQVPLNIMAGNTYTTLNTSNAITTIGYGKHYIGIGSVTTGGVYAYFLLRFLTTPTGSGTPQLGVYQTQTQLFSKRITVKQIRVYTEPTVTGNGFQVDCIGGDGAVITNTAPNTYAFAAGTDITLLQGALERIDFNPVMKNTHALGIRITNTGTTNMTINKIEIDWQFAGK